MIFASDTKLHILTTSPRTWKYIQRTETATSNQHFVILNNKILFILIRSNATRSEWMLINKHMLQKKRRNTQKGEATVIILQRSIPRSCIILNE